MNKLQKAVMTKLTSVLVFTLVAVVVFVNLRGIVNRSEAKRAMAHLRLIVNEYKERNGFLPPESFVRRAKQQYGWDTRLNDLRYRGLWITFESQPHEILAYTKDARSSFFSGNRHLILRLDGSIEWVGEKPFHELLSQQQSRDEIKRLQKIP